MSGPVNLYDLALERDPTDPPGYRDREAQFGPAIGAEHLGASVYEIDPGESVNPYHYEGVEEEWLLVLRLADAARPRRRAPAGAGRRRRASPQGPAAPTR